MGLSAEATVAIVGVVLAIPPVLLCFRERFRRGHAADLDKARDECMSAAIACASFCVKSLIQKDPSSTSRSARDCTFGPIITAQIPVMH